MTPILSKPRPSASRPPHQRDFMPESVRMPCWESGGSGGLPRGGVRSNDRFPTCRSKPLAIASHSGPRGGSEFGRAGDFSVPEFNEVVRDQIQSIRPTSRRLDLKSRFAERRSMFEFVPFDVSGWTRGCELVCFQTVSSDRLAYLGVFQKSFIFPKLHFHSAIDCLSYNLFL